MHTHARAVCFAPEAGLLSRAKAVLCTSPCRELGEHNETLRPYDLFSSAVPDEHTMTTWLPRDRVPVTMQRLPDGTTAIALGDGLYYASEAAALGRDCPQSVVFFGHYTEDGEGADKTSPRLLVYDVWYTEEQMLHPQERYSQLRSHLARHLAGPVCTVQWVGFRKAAEQILREKHSYPHDIESLVCLTPDCHRLLQPLLVCTAGLGFSRAKPQ